MMVQLDEVTRFSHMPEGQYFDRKSARIKPEDAVRHVIAFANASGGQLVIGIEDDGTITGFRRENAKPIESFEQLPITLCAPWSTTRASCGSRTSWLAAARASTMWTVSFWRGISGSSARSTWTTNVYL